MRLSRSSKFLKPELTINFPESVSWQSSEDHASTPVFLASQNVYGNVGIQGHDADLQPRTSSMVRVEFIGIYSARSWTVDAVTGKLRVLGSRVKEIVHMAKDFDHSLVVPGKGTDDLLCGSRSFSFVFQPCNRENVTVKLGHPSTDSQDTVPSNYMTTRLVCSRSIPSSNYTKIDYVQTKRKSLHVVIRYKVRASLIRISDGASATLAESCSNVTIFDDSNRAQPPTWTTDFGSEYALFRRAVLRSIKPRFMIERLSKQRSSIPHLFIEATEPPPLCFRRGSAYAITKMRVVITSLTQGDNLTYDDTYWPPNHIRFTWRLKRSTFCSLEPLKKIPTLEHTIIGDRETPVHLSVTKSISRTCDCGLHDWERDTTDSLHDRHNNDWPRVPSYDEAQIERQNSTTLDQNTTSPTSEKARSPTTRDRWLVSPSPTTTSSPPGNSLKTSVVKKKVEELEKTILPDLPTLTTAVSFPVVIPGTELPHPTSFSPYMCIRYSLQVHVQASFREDANTKIRDNEQGGGRQRRSNSHYTAQTDLEVPVQIVYEGENEDTDDMYGTDELVFAGEDARTGCIVVHDNGQPGRAIEEVLPSYSVG